MRLSGWASDALVTTNFRLARSFSPAAELWPWNPRKGGPATTLDSRSYA